MASDQHLQIDSPMRLRREREWLYFKLKEKVEACQTPRLSELKELDRLLTEIESSMENSFSSPTRLQDLDDTALKKLLEERRGFSATPLKQVTA